MAATETQRRAWFEREVLDLLPELHATARRLTRRDADAEDLVSDAVCRAWEKLDSLRSREAFRPWIHRILSNAYISECRTCAARGEHESLDAGDEDARFSLFERLHQPFLLWQGNPEEAFLRKLLREDLERAVDDLPDPFRVVVVMAEVQGFTYAEIADALDVPVGTVRSRLARGRARLQEALWRHRDGGLDASPSNPKEAGAPPPPERPA